MAALKNHPGLWLRDDAAAAINALEDKYGVIVINSAGRTVEDQQRLIDRYDAGDPTVYMPYRPPENSPHVRNGGAAVDVYNFRDDRAKLEEFGFQWTYGMDDPVHYDFLGWSGDGDGGASGSEEARLFLEALGYDTGGPGWGPKCDACAKDFQASVGLKVDGIWGPNTTAVQRTIEAGRNATDIPTKRIQQALANAGFNPGPIDDAWGNKTSRALFRWQGSVKLQQDAVFGPASSALLLPAAPVESEWNLTTRPTADIQRAVGMTGADVDGDHGSKTDAKIRAWQTAQGIDADGIWGRTSDGLAFPPAGSIHGCDYSMARPGGALLASRGLKFAGRYLAATDNAKRLTAAENSDLEAHGLRVFHIYEYDGRELLGGRAAGIEAATLSEQHRIREGLAAKPTYFNADFDVPDEDVPAILDALRGAVSVLGLNRVGLYGGIKIIRAAFDAGVIAWGFQTYAWSAGVWDPRAQLQQWSNGQWGDQIDYTRAVVPVYGQTPIVTPKPDPVPEPETPADLSGIAKLLQQILDLLKRIFGGAK